MTTPAPIVNPQPLPLITTQWTDPKTGLPIKGFGLYMQYLDQLIRGAFSLLNATAAINFLTQQGGQNITGGFTETPFPIPTPANGATVTLDPLNGLKQTIINNVAGFTIAAQTTVGDIELVIVNGATPGVVTFTGFVQWPGNLMDTVAAHQFVAFCYGFTGKRAYLIKALQ